MHPSLTIFDASARNFIRDDFEIRTLAGDCQFTEGPVWNPEGYYLFSDIPANVIFKIDEAGEKEVFLKNSGTNTPDDPLLKNDQAGSNGLAYDAAGGLLVCRHGSHELARWDGKEIQTLCGRYGGKPLNSPNDLIVHSDGRIYFSDPPYGLKDGKMNPGAFQPLGGVYSLKGDEPELVCDRYQYPNGVCLSPDERFLYICSNKPFEAFISVYETGTHRFLHILAKENSDGIEVDPHGNFYLANRDGVLLLNPRGERLALLKLSAIPANLCWGGKERKDLLVTAREKVFLIPDFLK